MTILNNAVARAVIFVTIFLGLLGSVAFADDLKEGKNPELDRPRPSLTLRIDGSQSAIEGATPLSNLTDLYAAFQESGPRFVTLGIKKTVSEWLFLRAGVGYGENRPTNFLSGPAFEIAAGTDWRVSPDFSIGIEWLSMKFLRDPSGLSFWNDDLALRLTFDLEAP